MKIYSNLGQAVDKEVVPCCGNLLSWKNESLCIHIYTGK